MHLLVVSSLCSVGQLYLASGTQILVKGTSTPSDRIKFPDQRTLGRPTRREVDHRPDPPLPGVGQTTELLARLAVRPSESARLTIQMLLPLNNVRFNLVIFLPRGAVPLQRHEVESSAAMAKEGATIAMDLANEKTKCQIKRPIPSRPPRLYPDGRKMLSKPLLVYERSRRRERRETTTN